MGENINNCFAYLWTQANCAYLNRKNSFRNKGKVLFVKITTSLIDIKYFLNVPWI